MQLANIGRTGAILALSGLLAGSSFACNSPYSGQGFSVDTFTARANSDGTYQVGMGGVRFPYASQYDAYCASQGYSYSNADLRFAHLELWAFTAPYSPGDTGIRLIASPELGLTMWNSQYPPSPMNSKLIFVGYGGSYGTAYIRSDQSLAVGTWYLSAFLILDDTTGPTVTAYANISPALTISGSASNPSPPPTPITPAIGLWWNPNESGSGYALDFKHGVLVVTIYSYKSTGEPQWYLAAGPVNGNVFTGTLDKYEYGQCISCSYRAASPIGNDGPITITFTSSTSATVQLPDGRVTTIQPQAF
jgi:hypothetical protein